MNQFDNLYKIYAEMYKNDDMLPFVHFTVSDVVYSDGKSISTGVIESFKKNGVRKNTSAIEIDGRNLKQSLSDAFDNGYHHSVRLNRVNLRNLSNKKPREAIGAVILIENNNQILNNTAIDFEGHVFLDYSNPETIINVFKIDNPNRRPIEKYNNLQNLKLDVDNNKINMDNLKNIFITKYISSLQ